MIELEEYYASRDEEARLLSQHGQVEYLTTMRYIHDCLKACGGSNILEIGAGTGRYSITLAREGYQVTAVELVEHNLEQLRKNANGVDGLTALQGNALDLSAFPDDSFDVCLLLGPMYHLFTQEDKLRALREALRVTKPGGFLLVAYCMNEPTVICYAFQQQHVSELLAQHMLTDDWHCVSEPKEIFELIRTEEIAALDRTLNADRVRLVATDGATNYMRETVDAMDRETFAQWMQYHLSICERADLIGASHHTLDILRKR